MNNSYVFEDSVAERKFRAQALRNIEKTMSIALVLFTCFTVALVFLTLGFVYGIGKFIGLI